MKPPELSTLSTGTLGIREPEAPGAQPYPRKPYGPKDSELLLGTDAVDVVVKAIVARAG